MLQERIKNDVIVSVNINPINLMDANFRSVLEDFARDRNVSNIELELVESDDFDKFLGFNEVVRGLSKLGYRLAIDDFGSRYAWINSLGEHVSTIKLDRTLTQRISKGSNASRAEVVVRSIVSMAKSIDIEVIAEGIEDKEDFNMMKSFGVTCMQGYYFGTPLLPEQFIENHVVMQENKQIFEELDKAPTLYESFNNKRH
jgi:EAL domain-containing protein (putative c-di-GMP-specific phosphodiesterase class I)